MAIQMGKIIVLSVAICGIASAAENISKNPIIGDNIISFYTQKSDKSLKHILKNGDLIPAHGITIINKDCHYSDGTYIQAKDCSFDNKGVMTIDKKYNDKKETLLSQENLLCIKKDTLSDKLYDSILSSFDTNKKVFMCSSNTINKKLSVYTVTSIDNEKVTLEKDNQYSLLIEMPYDALAKTLAIVCCAIISALKISSFLF
ncbi:MAG TPA: hypothetical protein VLB80_01910 [Candidatus Babeliales bacterium]|nr:hypothetical protein [Candidatus Babeliales bacterium]